MKYDIFNKTVAYTIAIFGLVLGSACSSGKDLISHKTAEVALVFDDYNVQRRFTGLDYGLRVDVTTQVTNETIIDNTELSSKTIKFLPKYTVVPQIEEFLRESLPQYIRRIGIPYNSSMGTDYTLRVNVRQFKFKQSETKPTAIVMLEYSLENADRQLVVADMTSTGRVSAQSASESISAVLNRAYLKALDGIDWDRIASELKIHDSAKNEANRMVDGSGNTALESTVIRWNILSSPLGADVSWRVVSSTPDVKNTNSNFVGSTPYETTESFDIKGLTYNNSGNVQIEVTCERAGYIPQKKRFNLRQAIDQKEISAKFNLVKDE